MFTINKLFGRSPFSPLLSHMGQVTECVYRLPDLFEALEKKDFAKVEVIAEEISKLEHQADKTKNDIRNHLPKTLFLAIDRSQLLEILSIQDNIADHTEDVAVLVNLKKLPMPPSLQPLFTEFLNKNFEAFEGVRTIIKELHDLMESSFGGVEAEKVRSLVHDIAHKEHEVDLLQRKLLKVLIEHEAEMAYTTFYLWQKILEAISSISNLSEKLANRVRMTLDLN